MCMDDIKLFAKTKKRIGGPKTGSQDIQWRYKDEI